MVCGKGIPQERRSHKRAQQQQAAYVGPGFPDAGTDKTSEDDKQCDTEDKPSRREVFIYRVKRKRQTRKALSDIASAPHGDRVARVLYNIHAADAGPDYPF